MPALPVRRSNKPFKPQRELKNPRTHAKLRTYAKRRASYNASAALVLAMFMVHYLPELRAWREERWRKAGLPNKKMWMRRHRRRLKIEARIVRLEVRRTELAAQIVVLEERVRQKALNLRKHATDHQGHVDGWTVAVPVADAELKSLSWSRRYREAYAQSAVEKVRMLATMARQQTPVVQPATIKL